MLYCLTLITCLIMYVPLCVYLCLPVSRGVYLSVKVSPGGSGSVMKYGFPSVANIKTRESYVSSYDPRTRTPSWVIERLTPASLNGPSDRKYCNFKEDERWDRNKQDGRWQQSVRQGVLMTPPPLQHPHLSQGDQRRLQGEWLWQRSHGSGSQSQVESESNGRHLLPEQCGPTGE